MDALSCPREIIDALGGTSAVARLFGFDVRVVSNWRSMDRLPAHTFVTLTKALAGIGRTASAAAWNMSPPASGDGVDAPETRSVA